MSVLAALETVGEMIFAHFPETIDDLGLLALGAEESGTRGSWRTW